MAGANVFSIGKDVSLTLVTQQGILTLPVTSTTFEAKPQYNKIRKVGLDGINRGANVPIGWEGTVELDRHDVTVDAFFAAAEAGYYAGANSYTGSITETIQEQSGAVTQFQYIGVVFSFDESGKWQGDKEVNQTIGFFASKKIQVS